MHMQSFQFFHKPNQVLELANWAEVLTWVQGVKNHIFENTKLSFITM